MPAKVANPYGLRHLNKPLNNLETIKVLSYPFYPCVNNRTMLRVIASSILILATLIAVAQPTASVNGKVFWSDGHESEQTLYIDLDQSGDSTVSFGTMQDEIPYIGDNDTRQYIRPRDVNRIEFSFNGEDHIIISSFFNSNYKLMECEKDGKLRVLRYAPGVGSDEMQVFETDEVTIRVLSIEGGNQGNNTKIFRLTFKRDMIDLFQGYPKMIRKVKEKEYTYDNWEAMVDYFNENFGD